MKLTKLVVASMSVLGLISCPALAATKHKHHHHKKVHHMVSHDFKHEGALPVQPAPVVSVLPAIDSNQVIMDAMTQNLNREVHGGPDWFQRIAVIGGINFDAMWGNRNRNYMGENYRRLSLNDAYLNATAAVNDWTKAFISLSFNNASPASNISATTVQGIFLPSGGSYPGIYSAAYTNNRLDLEQGYITFGNFMCSPFFVQLGKQFQDFGRYQIHPITRTLTQVLSESLQTSAKVGFLTPIWSTMSLHGSIGTFDNALLRTGTGHSTNVWDAALGIDMPSDQLGFDLGVGYMSNMTGINDVAYAISVFETITGVNPVGTYNATVGAINVYGDINSGPFSFGARYTQAIQNFRPATLSSQYATVFAAGARPWAADFTAAYGFNLFCKNQNVYIGYQTGNNSVNLFIPKHRYLAGYGIEPWKNTNLSVEYTYDSAYSSSNGVPLAGGNDFPGSKNSSNQVHARAAVRFG
ncbi:MAG: LbtU family siderophore porin [Gammaproteobacteria bacterium]